MSENVINGLIEQSKTLLQVIDDVLKLLNYAHMFYLTQAVNKTCTLANTYLKNFSAFMDEQLNSNQQKSI